jgi:hypothetical protein
VSQILTGFLAFDLVFTLSVVKSLAKMEPSLISFINYLLSVITLETILRCQTIRIISSRLKLLQKEEIASDLRWGIADLRAFYSSYI